MPTLSRRVPEEIGEQSARLAESTARKENNVVLRGVPHTSRKWPEMIT